MNVIFVRHGVPEGEDWMEANQASDDERPLTKEGAIAMERVSIGLKKLVPLIDKIIASPLVRAQETAQIIARAYNLLVETEDALVHGYSPSETLQALNRHFESETILCVGHQPNISATISYAIAGGSKAFVEMGRGAVCSLFFPNDVRPGKGYINFLIPRKVF